MHDHAPSSQRRQNDTNIPWTEGRTRSKRRSWRSTRGASSRGSPQTGRPSELVLEGFRRERLNDSLGRLRLHHDDFAEDLALPSFGRLLLAGLDHNNTWDDELAVLLGLLRCNVRESAQGRADDAPLHLAALRERRGEGALGHDRGF